MTTLPEMKMVDGADGDAVVPVEKGGAEEFSEPGTGLPCWAITIPLNTNSEITPPISGAFMTHPLGTFIEHIVFAAQERGIAPIVTKILQMTSSSASR